MKPTIKHLPRRPLLALMLSILFLSPIIGWGQSSLRIGGEAQIGASNLGGLGYSQLAYGFGLVGQYSVQENWSLGVGISFQKMGGWSEYQDDGGIYDTFYERSEVHFQYGRMALTSCHQLGSKWQLQIGPYLGLLLNAQQEISQSWTEGGNSEMRDFQQDVSGFYESMDIGLVSRLGYPIGDRWCIFGELQQGLVNVFTLSEIDRKYHQQNFGLGVQFWVLR